MVDQIIRPSDLPRRSSPVATEIVPVDNDVAVAGSTLKEIAEAGRPTASEAEALAGTDPFKAMTPLTTSQAIGDKISALNLGALSSKNKVSIPNDVEATGSANSATFLRGDGQWVIPPAGLKDDVVIYNPSGQISPGSYPIVLYSINSESYTRLRIGIYSGSGSCRVTLGMNGGTVTDPVVVTVGAVYSGTIVLNAPASSIISVLIDSIESVSAMYVQIDGNT